MSAEKVLEVMKGGRIPIAIGDVTEVRLLYILGTGGFGSVWKVSDTKTNKIYALKILQGVEPGSVLAERVRLEAEISIPSKYVIPAIGLREWDEQTFLILMEFFSGRPLDLLLEEKTLSDELKKRVFQQVLQGVADAHLCNIIHRDLKPSNILVDAKGDVKIIDFGLAKFKEKNLTGAGITFGTLPYIAPEIFIRGAKHADARADIYALGHILYELAMGMHFWKKQGWKKLEDLANFLNATIPPTEAIDLSDFSCNFYHNANDLIISMVKVNPDHRCASVEDIITALGGDRPATEMPANLSLCYPVLVVESGSNSGARTFVNLVNGGCVIGRVDLAGNDESISRKHLEFFCRSDRYFVRDLGSKNGTLVRGIALISDSQSAVEIQHGDRIKVGDIFLRFVLLEDV